MKDWVKLGESRTGIDLEIQKGLLFEKGEIHAVVINKKVSAYDLGNWELYVHKDEVQAAEAILKLG